MRLPHVAASRRLVGLTLAALMATGVAGCKTAGLDTTGSAALTAPVNGDWRREVEVWGERYQANPRDPDIAMRYARALRATGQRAQAVAVLEQVSMQHPKNMPLLGAYGRALADAGDYGQALEVLTRAHTPERPDWRILSAQGAVLDEMGRHQEAQRYYETALKIVPDEPSVLSNLGLSYALSKDLPHAEETLRRAAARPGVDARVRQNLALVIGLQGRFAEAETIARADLAPDDAAANVAYLRQMLAQQNDWKKLAKKRTADSRIQASGGRLSYAPEDSGARRQP